MDTNSIAIITSLENQIPPSIRPWVILLVGASPIIGRIYHAFANDGGIKGIVGAIWFGTNTPKQTKGDTNEKSA